MYDVDKLNALFRGLTARKISIISRLSGLNQEEINIMKLTWLDNLLDVAICDKLNCSTATLTRKRKLCYLKIMDAMDLYGLSDFESLPIMDVFDYGGLFYKAQDELVRYFIRHNGDEKMQQKLNTPKTLSPSY